MPTISELAFDDANLEKLDRHRLTPGQLREVLARRYIVVRNRRSGVASHILIGRDRGGRCIAIPIAPTTARTVWRPLTAWYCKESEEARLKGG